MAHSVSLQDYLNGLPPELSIPHDTEECLQMKYLKQLIASAAHRQLSKLDELYQRHAGQECYIFGDGISLKWMDLHQFADRLAILGNMTVYHKQVDVLRAPYCAVVEPYFFYPYFPYRGLGKLSLIRHYLQQEYRKTIIQRPETLFFVNISNYPVARFSNTLFVSRWYNPPFEGKNPFKDREDSHHGTFKFQLSLAIYMGFKKAYLVGHDYTHFPARSLHFHEKGEGIISVDDHRGYFREYINYAKQHIDLVTVTLDGCSETLNYITYKDLTGKEPVFRENFDLVDRVKLENLATWEGYSIF